MSFTAAGQAFANEPQPASSPSDWSVAQRIVFRFTFSYVVFYSLAYLLPSGFIPGISNLASAFGSAIADANRWLGKNVFKLSNELLAVQGGDAALEYVGLCTIIGLAGVATIAWSLLDRARSHYRVLHHWLRLYVRYTLAAIMLG